MTNPSPVATFQSYFQKLWSQLRNPSALFRSAQNTTAQVASQAASQGPSVLQQLRNVNRSQLVTAGVVLAECIGFFTVGEMIGRFKLIGYHGEGAHH